LEQEEKKLPESVVRQRRQAAETRDRQRWRDAQQRQRASEAANRARIRFPAAQDLEKMGKIAAALNYYNEIAQDAPATKEGRLAAERIAVLSTSTTSP